MNGPAGHLAEVQSGQTELVLAWNMSLPVSPASSQVGQPTLHEPSQYGLTSI